MDGEGLGSHIIAMLTTPPLVLHSMHVLPNSHGRGVYKHDAASEFHIDYGMVDLPNPNDVCV